MDRKLTNRNQEIVEILPNLRRFALSLTGNMADADDLLQSTVERLLARGIPDDAHVLKWSFRVCRNLWIDETRSRKVREDTDQDPDAIGALATPGESQVIGELALGEAGRAMLAIPAEQRAVLELVAIEGYSYKEAAGLLEVPIGTVMSRLARARARLIDECGTEATTPNG